MKSSVFLFVIIAVIGVSCANNGNKEQHKTIAGSFDSVYSVAGKEILKDQYNILTLNVADTFLLATLRDTKDYYFTLYNAKTLTKVMDVAPHGKGPGEFSGGLSYQNYEMGNGHLYLWVWAYNSQKLIRINLSESVSQHKTIPVKVLKIGIKDGFISSEDFHSIYYIDSTKVVGRSTNLALHINRFLSYNPVKGRIINKVPPFPKVKYDSTKKDEGHGFLMYRYNPLYNAGFRMKPDKTKFASAMGMFNRLDIFDADGNLINSYIDDDNITDKLIKEYLSVNENNVKNVPVKNYYADSFVTDSFIYTLYHNKLASDWKTSVPVQIRIFNWEAEPLCTIKIPDYLQHISIDEANGILYGNAINDEKVLKYDISSILNEIK